jgi:hypothetical protein
MEESPEGMDEQLADLEEKASSLGVRLANALHKEGEKDGLVRTLALAMLLGAQLSDAPDDIRAMAKACALRRIDQALEAAEEMGLAGRGTLVQ